MRAVRVSVLLLAALGAAGTGYVFASYGPGADVAAFARVVLVAGLLVAAVVLPLALSARADLLRTPWRALAGFVSREAPFEASLLAMLAAALLLAVLPLGPGAPPLVLGLALLALGLGAAAASVENLFPYVPGTTE